MRVAAKEAKMRLDDACLLDPVSIHGQRIGCSMDNPQDGLLPD
jgi:hypothetical protein